VAFFLLQSDENYRLLIGFKNPYTRDGPRIPLPFARFNDPQGPPKDCILIHVQGPTASGAAVSSIAHETAVSFSSPPQRVPPRSSNDPKKR
jgi:hypothetical protein